MYKRGDHRQCAQAVSALEKRTREQAATMVTMSEHGVYVHDKKGEHLIAAHRRKIADVSGAGDTVIAIATLALAQGLPFEQVAAFGQPGRWTGLRRGRRGTHRSGTIPR